MLRYKYPGGYPLSLNRAAKTQTYTALWIRKWGARVIAYTLKALDCRVLAGRYLAVIGKSLRRV